MSDASPRFRQDLATSPVEADGVPCVDVSDPRTGTSFRFYDFEYQLALQLNGQPVTGVLSWASEAFGADLTADGVNEFATRLRELGFLEGDAAATLEVPHPESARGGGVRRKSRRRVDDGAERADRAVRPRRRDAGRRGADAHAGANAVARANAVAGSRRAAGLARVAAGGPGATRGRRARRFQSRWTTSMTARPGRPPSRRRSNGWSRSRRTITPQADSRTTPAWALALDDAPEKSTAPSTAEVTKEVKLPPAPVPTVAPPPPGVPERRQPPAPDAVVMAAFTGEAAKTEEPPRRSRAPLVIGLVLVAGAAAAGLWYWKNQHRAAGAAGHPRSRFHARRRRPSTAGSSGPAR